MPDASFVLPLVLHGALLPFAVTLAALASARALRLGGTAVLVAAPAGLLAAYAATLHGQWSLVPRVALDWLPWIAVAGAAAAAAAEKITGTPTRRAARLAISLAAAALVVWPAAGSLGPLHAALAALAAGVLTALAWSVKAHAAARRPTPPLLLAVVAGGAGLALMLDSSQSIGQLCGALAAVLAACAAWNVPRARTGFPPAAAGFAVLVLGVLLTVAHLYAGFPLASVALLGAALAADPLRGAVQRLRRGTAEPPAWAAATALTAIPVVATIGLALKAAQDAGGY